LRLSTRAPFPTATCLPSIEIAALSGASKLIDPNAGRGRTTESLGGSVSVTTGVTGGETGGGVTAAPESGGFTGVTAWPLRDLLNIDTATVSPAMRRAPAIQVAPLDRFGGAPFVPAAG
jgi:hypothetical protein